MKLHVYNQNMLILQRLVRIYKGRGVLFIANQRSPILVESQSSRQINSKSFCLLQNYPNLFNPVTTISFALIMAGKVNLTIYDSNGKTVNRLINRKLKVGQHAIDFSGESYSSGLYFCLLQILHSSNEGFEETRKMLLIK